MLAGEGAEQAHLNVTDLPAVGVQPVHGIAGHTAHRTHGDDDFLGVGRAVVVEEMVGAAGDAADVAKIAFHDLRHGVVEAVGGFASLKIDVAVLHRTAKARMLRIQRASLSTREARASTSISSTLVSSWEVRKPSKKWRKGTRERMAARCATPARSMTS